MSDTASSASANQGKLISPPENFVGSAHCPSMEAYQEMYDRSIKDPDGFWSDIADTFVWEKISPTNNANWIPVVA